MIIPAPARSQAGVGNTSLGRSASVQIPSQKHFTDHGTILPPGTCGAWDWWLGHVIALARFSGLWLLYYIAADGSRPDAACDSTGSRRNRFLGVSTCSTGDDPTNAANWTKSGSNPLIEHQPSGGVSSGLSGEGGVLFGGTIAEASRLILHFGGMEETSNEQVDADVVYVETTDGIAFTDQSDAGKAGTIIGDDEDFPLGSVEIGGTYYTYYTAKGTDVTSWTLSLLSGADPSNYGSSAQLVSGPTAGEARGGGGIIQISDSRILFPMETAPGPGADIELRSAPTSDPSDLSTLEDTWSWPNVDGIKLFLDRERGEWLLPYIDSTTGTGHNLTISLKTAPAVFI